MKVLSFFQTNAYLIAAGIKNVENRTWKTEYRGKILIHASRKNEQQLLTKFFPISIQKEYINILQNKNQSREEKIQNMSPSLKKINELALLMKNYFSQAIIGECEIIDIQKNYNSIWAEKNCFNWIIDNPKLYQNPIENINGKLSLWEFNIDILPSKYHII